MSSSEQAQQAPQDEQDRLDGLDMTQLSVNTHHKASDVVPDPTTAKRGFSPALTHSLLRDYRTHLDPLNIGDAANMDREEWKDLRRAVSTPLTVTTETTLEPLSTSVSASPSMSPIAKPNGHSRNVSGSVQPHRSLLKALASRTSNENLRRQTSPTSHQGLGDLASTRTPLAARLTQLPCLFHQRFDDAVNIDRVLEEVSAEDNGMSHSRLIQTATSVREISKQLQRRPIKRAVRNIMIITKARDNKLVYLTRELAEWLMSTPRYNSDLGVTVYVDAKLAKSKRFDGQGLVASNPRYEQMLRYWTPDLCWSTPEKFDLVITLGGDGTVLYTSWLFQRIVPPILSFSLGSLGFLTNFSFPSYKPTLDRIMEGPGMRVNMRMRFTCTVYRSTRSHRSRASSLTSTTSSRPSKSSAGISALTSDIPTPPSQSSQPALVPDGTYQVLNELVLDRGPSPYVSNLELYGDSHLLTIIQADGCIISTPTGSTAYSLSAGGPLTHPSIPGILLTPICPHTLSFRPMVLSDTLLLRLVVPQNSRSTAYASFDGKGRVELRRGDEVRVEAGRYPFPTVVGESGEAGVEWFESVRRALRWNTRGVVQGGFASSGGGQRLADYDELVEDEERMYGANGSAGGNAAGRKGSTDYLTTPDGELDALGIGPDGVDGDEPEEEWDIDPDPVDGNVFDHRAGSVNAAGGAGAISGENSGAGLPVLVEGNGRGARPWRTPELPEEVDGFALD